MRITKPGILIILVLLLLWVDDGAVSSEDDFSTGDGDTQDGQARGEDRELKDRLLRRFGSRISTLKLEFSKKKKKGKLPKEARQSLLEWWSVHYKWPYPTVNIYAFYLGLSLYHSQLFRPSGRGN